MYERFTFTMTQDTAFDVKRQKRPRRFFILNNCTSCH